MAAPLSRFTIEPDTDGYLMHIEDDDGNVTELTATAEQLDLIAEAIDEHLDSDDADLDDYADEEEEAGQ